MTDLRILVVDDAPEFRRLIGVLIDRHGHGWTVVAQAADGREGVEQARAAQPDLVLLDISMPVMDGIEALPLIRQAAPAAVVVILTGYPDATVRGLVASAGAHGFLEKDDLFRSLVPHLESILAAVPEPRPGSAAAG